MTSLQTSFTPKSKCSFKDVLLKAITKIRGRSTRNSTINNIAQKSKTKRINQSFTITKSLHVGLKTPTIQTAMLLNENKLLKERVKQLQKENQILTDKLASVAHPYAAIEIEKKALAKLETVIINEANLRKQLSIMRQCNLEYIRTHKTTTIIDSVLSLFGVLDSSCRWYSNNLISSKYQHLALLQQASDIPISKVTGFLEGLSQMINNFNDTLYNETGKKMNSLYTSSM